MVLKFDSTKADAKGRPLGWALALMEMLVDPMLASWVPSWVREQYERWNPYFRPCLRSALREYTKKRKAALRETDVVAEDLRDGDVLVKNSEYLRLPHTNKNLLWSVRQRMIFRCEKHKDDAALLLPDAGGEGL